MGPTQNTIQAKTRHQTGNGAGQNMTRDRHDTEHAKELSRQERLDKIPFDKA